MKTTVTPLDDNQVRVEIEVSDAELVPALDAAAREISQSVSLKGFRRGKVPRKVLERHIGPEAIYEEAVKHAVPVRLAEAIEAEDLDMIGRPEIDEVSGSSGEPLKFAATFAVRPEIEIGDLSEIEVRLESRVEPTDDEVSAEIDSLRDRFATPETVSRAAQEGDYCLINIDGHIHSERIDELSRQDFMYEVGSEALVPELDSELTGTRAGEIVKFNSEIPEGAPVHGGDEVAFNVLVKEVKEKVLPSLDDDWVQEASEFDTVDELRAEIRNSIRSMKRVRAREEAHQKAIEAVVAAAGLRVPDSLVSDELDRRQHELEHQIAGSGMSLDDFLSSQGESVEAFRDQLREGAKSSVEAMLVMGALASEADLTATPAEIGERVADLAEREGTTTARMRRQLDEAGRLDTIASAIISAKTSTHLLEGVTVVDDTGEPVALDEPDETDATETSDASDAAHSADSGDGDPETGDN